MPLKVSSIFKGGLVSLVSESVLSPGFTLTPQPAENPAATLVNESITDRAGAAGLAQGCANTAGESQLNAG